MLWIGEVEGAKSIDDLITSASIPGEPIPDFEDLDFKIASGLKKNPNRELQTSKSSQQKKSSIREASTHGQTDCLDHLRHLQNYWTSEIYRKFN